MESMDRQYDVVVFGASGYVGRLIAKYLAENGEGARIAVAGRSLPRLQEMALAMGETVQALPRLVADSARPDELLAMARQAKVVLSTVGPYSKHGLALVGACIEAGTHYVDLTGETLFVRDCIDAFDAAAQARGVAVVHACGFDSVPGDLGVLEAWRKAQRGGLGELAETTFHLREFSGGMSGGTIDSIRTQIDSARAGIRKPGRSASDPYALSPDRGAEPEPVGRKGHVLLEVSPDTREWTAPFLMGRYNAQVVRRSNALQGWAYGRTFRYSERHDAGTGVTGLVKATGIAAVLPALAAGLSNPVTRPLVDSLLPKPGEGPSEKARANGHFLAEVHGLTTSGKTVKVEVSDRRDPGYDGTAVMIGEAALALAAGEAGRHGDLTPASALGATLPDRLRAKGFTLG